MRDVFFGDVLGGRARFRAMYSFLLDSMVLADDRSCLLSLPPHSRTALLELAAAFLPYYTPPHVSTLHLSLPPLPGPAPWNLACPCKRITILIATPHTQAVPVDNHPRFSPALPTYVPPRPWGPLPG